MVYSPHVLIKRILRKEEMDEYERPVIVRGPVTVTQAKPYSVNSSLLYLNAHVLMEMNEKELPEYEWVEVCSCRCDHNATHETRREDGTICKPEFVIVADTNLPEVNIGDFIRCLEKDGTIRGEGEVINLQTLNYLPYAKIYV